MVAGVVLAPPYTRWAQSIAHLKAEAQQEGERPTRALAGIVRLTIRPRKTIVGYSHPPLLVWWFHVLRVRRIDGLFYRNTQRLSRVPIDGRPVSPARFVHRRFHRRGRRWTPFRLLRSCRRLVVEARLARALYQLVRLTARYDPRVENPEAPSISLATYWWGESSR